MEKFRFRKPKLPTHLYTWCESPDASGEEALLFVSERRRVKLKGRSFREFQQYVLPLLDGRHTVAEIQESVSQMFSPVDIERCLSLLAAQNLLENQTGEDEFSASFGENLMPQLNFLHEVGRNSKEVQHRLSLSTVSVIGMGGAGAQSAISLATTGVGCLRCIDSSLVTPGDTYLAPQFSPAEVGLPRAKVVAERLRACAPNTKTVVQDQELANDSDVASAIAGSDFVINCLDRGQASLAYKLNRACLTNRIRWTSGMLSGTEVVLGPTVHPFESPCYLCFKMRAVACAGNPEDEFAFESFLDRRNQDDSNKRENVVFGSGLMSNCLGMEAFNELAGIAEPSALGAIVVYDLLTMESTKHVVLRKPWCPACFDKNPSRHRGSQT
jgi:bacteriocin biosynthesis cyclodehydratase domain-containing protein